MCVCRSSFLALLCVFVSNAYGANMITETTTRLHIDAASSTLQRFVHEGVETNPIGPEYSFGGIVDVTIVNYYVDTLTGGAPRTPIEFSNVALSFVSLDLPSEVADFEPLFSFEPIVFDDGEITGARQSGCAYENATGGYCTEHVVFAGIPGKYEGTFDGTTLQISGYPNHSFFAAYYQFSVAASVVPLPSGILLFAPAMAVFARCARRTA